MVSQGMLLANLQMMMESMSEQLSNSLCLLLINIVYFGQRMRSYTNSATTSFGDLRSIVFVLGSNAQFGDRRDNEARRRGNDF